MDLERVTATALCLAAVAAPAFSRAAFKREAESLRKRPPAPAATT